jgi:hypothetical protein
MARTRGTDVIGARKPVSAKFHLLFRGARREVRRISA